MLSSSLSIAAARLPEPLIELHSATVAWHAGLAPSCFTSVRLLDQVHFTVHAGECIVVRHNDATGARLLSAALAGTARLDTHQALTTRRLRLGVRVRRARIHADLVAPITTAWQQSGAAQRATGAAEPPLRHGSANAPRKATVHLLRATRTTHHGPGDARAHRYLPAADEWERWAAAMCQGGHAIVLLVARDDDPRVSPFADPGRRPSQLRDGEPRAGSHHRLNGAVRDCLLHNGRLSPLPPAAGVGRAAPHAP
jgi:hypothetical protein